MPIESNSFVEEERAEKRRARLKLLRGLLSMANLWSLYWYIDAVKGPLISLGYPLDIYKNAGLAAAAIAASGWLHSVRTGAVVQVLVFIALWVFSLVI